MKGAIIGDIVGSVYEFDNIKTTEFNFYSPYRYATDDSVLTVATAKALMEFPDPENAPDAALEAAFLRNYLDFGRRYPGRGYGGAFRKWLHAEYPKPYYSSGNGSAMRVAPIAYVATSLESAVRMARLSAKVSHDHPDGICGAEATAGALYLALHGGTVDDVIDFVARYYPHVNELPSLKKIRQTYTFDHYASICEGTVPYAVHCLREARDFEHAIRLIVSIGGDTDTLGAIGGGIAEALYPIPDELWEEALEFVPEEMQDIIDRFYERFVH